MAQWTIHRNDGEFRADVKSLKYSGTYMGESNVSVDINCHKPIPFAIGDYIDYRGERYVLNSLPKVERNARDNTYGGAVKYSDVVFRSMAMSELENCMMLDYVKDDNGIHYTSLPNFAFYADKNLYVGKDGLKSYSAGVRQLADRIEANLERMYGTGSWNVIIEDFVQIKESVSISVSSQNVWNVLADACKQMDINFTARVYTENGDITRKEIVLGARLDTMGVEFKYGMGNGLTSLERNVNNSQQIITRLSAYGNTRNLPYRYYNYLWYREIEGKRVFKYHRLENDAEDATTEKIWLDGNWWYRVCEPSMYIPNLMLPMFRQNGKVAYIDSKHLQTLGVKEGAKFFDKDGEDISDIYPSITGITTEVLYNAMTPQEREAENIHDSEEYDQGEIDMLFSAEQVDFTGIIPEEQKTSPTFTLIVKNLGFDPNEQIIDNETPAIEMKSGKCVGRKFNIKSVYKNTEIASPAWVYEFVCEVQADDSINQYFPNVNYQINTGDEFVLTGIRMPDIYVATAEVRLEAAAKAWLAENDHTQYTYSPKIDNIFMARHPEIADAMKEGKKMRIVDESLDIDETVVISQLTINEGKEIIPEWEVTLSDEIEPSLAQRVVNEVNATVFEQIGRTGGGSMDGNMYDSIVTMLQGLPDQYISKTSKDTAQGPLSLIYSVLASRFETHGYIYGNGSQVSDGAIEVVSSDGKSEVEVDLPKVAEDIATITQKGTETITTNQFSIGGAENGGSVVIPFSCTWGKIVITETILRVFVVNGDTPEKVHEYVVPGGVNNYNIELELPHTTDTMQYYATAEVSYKPYSAITGSLHASIGNDNNKVMATLYGVTSKSIATLTAEKLEIKNVDDSGNIQSGMRMTNDGLQTWFGGEWREVVLQLDNQ